MTKFIPVRIYDNVVACKDYDGCSGCMYSAKGVGCQKPRSLQKISHCFSDALIYRHTTPELIAELARRRLLDND